MREIIGLDADIYKLKENVVIAVLSALLTLFFIFMFSEVALCQNKFFGVPNRSIEGGKGNTQIKTLNDGTLQNRQDIQALQNTIDTSLTTVIGDVGTLQAAVDASLTSVSDCGNLGMLGGPEHATANAQDCLPSLIVETSGETVFSRPTRHLRGLILRDNETCHTDTEGMLRYIAAQKSVMLCTGTTWIEVGAAPAASDDFTPEVNANLAQIYTSNSVSISGFFGTKTATVTGGAILIVNGVSQGNSAFVEAGDSVALRMTSSATFNTAKSTTFSLSSFSQTWTITTKTQDTTPNAFNFTDITNQDVSTLVTSNSLSIGGFDGPLTVSVSGNGSPQLQVAGGAWVTSASINPGQSLRLRLTTSNSYSTANTATVNLGTISTAWSVTTQAGTCTLPWGGTINSGQSVMAYQSSSVACGQTCTSQSRTCSGGVLSGSYTHQSCSVGSCGCVYPHQGGCATTANPERGSLIAAATDAPTSLAWGSDGILRAMNQWIGGVDFDWFSWTDGTRNTWRLADIRSPANAHPAAMYCSNLTLNGFSDWYLPAVSELRILYENRIAIGQFMHSMYWTSTEAGASAYNAFTQNFINGTSAYTNEASARYSKSGALGVRCVRKAN